MMSKPSINANSSSLEKRKSQLSLSLYRILYSRMSAPRILHRLARPVPSSLSTITRLNRQFGAAAQRLKDGDDAAPEVKAHRANQANKAPNQFIPNTTSTMTNDFINVGQKPPPPEMLNSVDPNYRPSDPYPGRIEHLTGGRQDNGAQKPELGVGEMEGITFKVEPLKRVGEELATKRARLLYQSRKRGILESDLLLSTFADVYLGKMNYDQLVEYDSFLDENDWDIYYWATQDPPEEISPSAPKEDTITETWKETGAKSGEWAQTIGAFRAAYRPVPSRWQSSEVLKLLREHVRDKSATGFEKAKNKKTGGGGLGRMPDVQVFNS
ncbi:hypothetical protein VN97_g8465 [Penicillium thymicola]|uniref:Succinate dehydrogenase assembly factor 2, mitochondrial n=1 Tax=Penicillium thymicola TaxID=293382 RepID=A0AAI9TDQ8_PENTH|nr:hypothetical protein VN97_g8465 [Penicillium thymicola]